MKLSRQLQKESSLFLKSNAQFPGLPTYLCICEFQNNNSNSNRSELELWQHLTTIYWQLNLHKYIYYQTKVNCMSGCDVPFYWIVGCSIPCIFHRTRCVQGRQHGLPGFLLHTIWSTCKFFASNQLEDNSCCFRDCWHHNAWLLCPCPHGYSTRLWSPFFH